jgi:predicted AlkP superfamily phosphohydrolase/phosphomutase
MKDPQAHLGRAVLVALALSLAVPAQGYVGPGAGFALLSSFAVVLTTLVLAAAAILLWPFRTLYRRLSRGKPPAGRVKRLIIVGFDGQDPRLTDRFLAEGKLPNFKKLAAMGCYKPLASTYPSLSPVAWSSFSTGTHPAKHNIFDFIDRDRRTYLPMLSSARIGDIKRFWKLGKWRIPREKPELSLLRRSTPFWTLLGQKGIWSTVLRVPITFPPDRFYGAELSAMCVPDLLGTQGTFLFFSTRASDGKFKEGGVRVHLPLPADGKLPARFETRLEGPENLFLADRPPLAVPLVLVPDVAAGKVTITVGEEEAVTLAVGELSGWVSVHFKAAPGVTVAGITRLQVTELGEHLSLYVAPINLDPASPAMPISHPSFYSTYLSKRVGPFATLGLAEDTWSLNEKVVDDGTFLKQALDIDDERRSMFWAGLDRLRKGSLVCVFDATDRIQHMFWRYLEKDHPAHRANPASEHQNAIEELYKRNDELVGQVMAKMRKGDMLMVLSDHGFTSFRRGVNVNGWLLANGYLHLKEGKDGSAEWLADIDWSRTRAYAVGLAGFYLNLEGREAQGIVKPGAEAEALKAEIVQRLSGLRDEEKKEVGIREVFDSAKLYQGPYLESAPDFIVGYNHGYRVSWDSATGMVAGPIFEDNLKAWSGDHCVDPRIVPGVFFCSHKIDVDEPALMDVAPTALTLFGLEPPKHMDARPLFAPGALKADPFAKKKVAA